jgi:hypothetical protein
MANVKRIIPSCTKVVWIDKRIWCNEVISIVVDFTAALHAQGQDDSNQRYDSDQWNGEVGREHCEQTTAAFHRTHCSFNLNDTNLLVCVYQSDLSDHQAFHC